MEKTVCELFAGVGGFRCGLNDITSADDYNKKEKWETVWFSQWEPAEKKTQYAHACYVYHFGSCYDIDGNDTTNYDIEEVDKCKIPDFNLLVGGFPCQDYSVASTLSTSKGLEGKKGILWWSIRETLEAKQPPFVLLENVDRLLKSPAKQRGRDFGIILACFRDEGYTVEWRVINAADYGYQQRRRRVFIFAYKNDTKYAVRMAGKDKDCFSASDIISSEGFFAKAFPIETFDDKRIVAKELPYGLGDLSEHFVFCFENAGVMMDGVAYTVKTSPKYDGERRTLGGLMDEGDVAEEYFIPEDRLYYTVPEATHSDETGGRLSSEARHTWQYIKGAKKYYRKASNGHEYVYSEGPVPMIDESDKPARTMLTSEGNFSRTTHIVRDKQTGRIRLLTPEETERIQGFPTNHTKYCLVDGEVVQMPGKKRRFMMGNALVVDLIKDMEKVLSDIFEEE
ncbi:MAG: DNA (cytosine-5-)-methyltransferase [Lachnospiraceae bacterium]|nr:DNA (cytosine-5-)-methyltransferase [Lachnospiraceae bacterium]